MESVFVPLTGQRKLVLGFRSSGSGRSGEVTWPDTVLNRASADLLNGSDTFFLCLFIEGITTQVYMY